MTVVSAATRRLLVATTDVDGLLDLRGPLIEAVVQSRHKVFVLTPSPSPQAVARLERLGAVVATTPFAHSGINPFGPMLVRRDLTAQIRTFAPDTLAYCDAAAALALSGPAAHAGVPRTVAMLPRVPVAGAGSTDDTALQRTLARVSAFVVETPEERRALATAPWLDGSVTMVAIPAAGVDLAAHPVEALPSLADGLTFMLVSSADDAAARAVFNDAAARLTGRGTTARFVDRQTAPDPASLDRMICASHVAVHASSRDGLARGLIVALAAGRPIVTTDVAASRDTVDERVNGCRVAPGDAGALADAMASILKRADLIPPMARASRLKAERRYDLTVVNAATLEVLGLNGGIAAAA